MLRDKLSIQDDIEFDRYHRIGKRRVSRPRTIICRFIHFKDKHKILQNAKKLKNTGVYIYEDLSIDTMELRKSLREEVLNYRRQGKLALSQLQKCCCKRSFVINIKIIYNYMIYI